MSRVVTEARLWLGTPYIHQASCRGAGADCLGLIRGVWRAVHGAEPWAVPPYTADWSEPQGDEALHRACAALLPPGQGGAGDLLLFRMRDGAVAKHLGLQSGPDRFIHAMTGHGTIESPLSTPWAARLVARFDLDHPFTAET